MVKSSPVFATAKTGLLFPAAYLVLQTMTGSGLEFAPFAPL